MPAIPALDVPALAIPALDARLLDVPALDVPALDVRRSMPRRSLRAPWRKGPDARSGAQKARFSAVFPDFRPRGGAASAPALFRTNNYRKNDMA